MILLTFVLTVSFASAAETNQTDEIIMQDEDTVLQTDIPIEADTFQDIQDAVDASSDGDTIYLNGRTYTGNGTAIKINKSITISGSGVNDDSKAILDGNDSSRILHINGNYNVVLKNIIFTRAGHDGDGMAVAQTSGNLTLTNIEIKDINFRFTKEGGSVISIGSRSRLEIDTLSIHDITERSTNYISAQIMVGANSQAVLKNIDYQDIYLNSSLYSTRYAMRGGLFFANSGCQVDINQVRCRNFTFTARHSLLGALIYAEKGSRTNLSNMDFGDVYISTEITLNGILHVSQNSRVVMNNLTIHDSSVNITRNSVGLIYVYQSATLEMNNFTYTRNNLTSGNLISGGLIYANTGSTVKANGLTCTENGFFAYSQVIGGLIRAAQKVKVNLSDVCFSDNTFLTPAVFGGALYTLEYCEITLNKFAADLNRVNGSDGINGGIMRIYANCTLNMTNLSFYHNYLWSKATITGGLVRTATGNATFTNCYAFNNTMECNYSASLVYLNGALHVVNITFNNNNFLNNDTEIDPYHSTSNICHGAVMLYGTGGIYNSTFSDNYARAGLGVALQISPKGGLYVIDNCKFFNNLCGAALKNHSRTFYKDHGGAVCVSGSGEGYSKIVNCLFVNNTNSQGGAITPHNNCILENCRFINNTATKFYGGAISTEDEIDKSDANISIINCYFEGNAAPIGGAIQAKGDRVTIDNCTFKDNDAVQGGAVFLEGKNLKIFNSTFYDNNATHELDSRGIVTGQDYLRQIQNWTAFGGAVYIHGENARIINNRFMYNSAIHATEDAFEGKGGAIYIYGNKSVIIKCHFDDNFAHSGNGSAVYILGSDAQIITSKFFNHDSSRGTVFIRGSHANITDSLFRANTASLGGAGIYSIGNNSLVDMCRFENNNATVHGGAIHTHGDYIRILNSKFISNNAHPDDNDHEMGLGGAIYTRGDSNDIAYCNFEFNTARNGSAIYNRGFNLTVEDCRFHYNQAYSYLLAIEVTPVISNYTKNNRIIVNITHIGGDNIINAIYNDGSHENIFFYNVTYEHSSIPGGERNSGFVKVNPVASAELSQNGELIYQDSREDLQIIDLIITRERDDGLLMASPISGDVIKQSTGRTGLYGNLSMVLTGDLKPGLYNVYASHPDDKLYKGIENSTRFEISPQVDLSIKKSSDRDSYFVGETATFTITLESLGTDAHDVKVFEILPQGFEVIGYTASAGTYSGNVWSIPLVAEKSRETLTLKVRAGESGTFTNVVNVTCRENDTDPSNNVARKTVRVKDYVDLKVTKTSDVKSVKVGDKIVWTITLTNEGIIKATGVKVKDKLPSSLKYLSHSSDKGEYDYKTGIWDVGEVAVNETLTLIIETEALKAGKITNSITVTSNEDDINSSDNRAKCTVEAADESDDSGDDVNETQDGGKSMTAGKTLSAKQNMHATGNPIMMMLLALLLMTVASRRKLK